MLHAQAAFGGFSVDAAAKAKDFYTTVLGLKLKDDKMGLDFELPGGGRLFVYEKKDHKPAVYTVLNFVVENIDAAIDELAKDGVKMEHYDNLEWSQDDKGVARGLASGHGPDIAWFTDPAGNIISIMQVK